MVDTEDTRHTTDNITGMAFKLPTGELKMLEPKVEWLTIDYGASVIVKGHNMQ